MLRRLAAPEGRDVVDIGCGGGELVRALAGLGARPIGVEISEQQLAPALAADDGSGARYVVGRGERLPLADESVDLAVFMRTLHHVPPDSLLPALREVRRVLRSGGAVYVAEPLAEGDFFKLTVLVDDEREVRAAAQAALHRAGEAGLERARTVDYDVRMRIDGIDALRARVVSVDPERAPVFDARAAEIAEAYARLGEPADEPGARWFVQPMRADLLKRRSQDPPRSPETTSQRSPASS